MIFLIITSENGNILGNKDVYCELCDRPFAMNLWLRVVYLDWFWKFKLVKNGVVTQNRDRYTCMGILHYALSLSLSLFLSLSLDRSIDRSIDREQYDVNFSVTFVSHTVTKKKRETFLFLLCLPMQRMFP